MQSQERYNNNRPIDIDITEKQKTKETRKNLKKSKSLSDAENTALKCKDKAGVYVTPIRHDKTPYSGLKRVSGHPTSKDGKDYSGIYKDFIDLLNREKNVVLTVLLTVLLTVVLYLTFSSMDG